MMANEEILALMYRFFVRPDSVQRTLSGIPLFLMSSLEMKT